MKSAQAKFETNLNNIKTSTSSQWREVQKSFDNQVAAARSKAAEGKASLDLTVAQERAYDAETYADIATNFANLAAAEASEAIVEAAEARATRSTSRRPPRRSQLCNVVLRPFCRSTCPAFGKWPEKGRFSSGVTCLWSVGIRISPRRGALWA